MVNHRPLLARVEALPPKERAVIHVLAVSYRATTVRDLVDLCVRAGVVPHSWTQKATKALLGRMVQAEVCQNGRRADMFRVRDEITHLLTREIARTPAFQRITQQILAPHRHHDFGFQRAASTELVRDLQIAIHLHDVTLYQRTLAALRQDYADEIDPVSTLARICDHPPDPQWLRPLPAPIREDALNAIVQRRADMMEPLDEVLPLLDAPALAETRAHARLIRGAADVMAPPGGRAHGAALFLRGDAKAAVRELDAVLRGWRRDLGRRKVFHTDQLAIVHLFARLQLDDPKAHKRVLHDVEAARVSEGYQPRQEAALSALAAVAQVKLGAYDLAIDSIHTGRYRMKRARLSLQGASDQDDTLNPYLAWGALATSQVDPKLIAAQQPQLEVLLRQAEQRGYPLVALAAAEALRGVGVSSASQRAVELRKRHGIVGLAKTNDDETWIKALGTLTRIGQASMKADSAPNRRMAWMMSAPNANWIRFQAREQTRRANSAWTAGRNVALKRLAEGGPNLDYMTPQDRKMCACIKAYSSGYYGQVDYDIDDRGMLAAAIGHPHIFLADAPSQRVEIVQAPVEIEVDEHPEGYRVKLSEPVAVAGTRVKLESPTRVVVTPVTETHRRISNILGDKLIVPREGIDQLQRALASLAGVVTIRSELQEQGSHAEVVEADQTIHARLRPDGPGFRVALFVKPLGDGGPMLRPGAGGTNMMTSVNGRALQTRRDLAAERESAWEVVAACAALEKATTTGELAWRLPDAMECLDLLLSLSDLGERVVVEWPEGEKLRPPRKLTSGDLRASVRAAGDWFNIGAQLTVDEDRVIELRALIELLGAGVPRFVELAPGEFLALTERLRGQVATLGRLGEPKGDGIRVGIGAAPVVADTLEGVPGAMRSRRLRTLVERMRAPLDDGLDAVPETLRATLRPYQREGYAWAARLADIGLGACLADDMGLGKTVQALALLVKRAPDGPALVIAPTSVCAVWVAEAARFAPTLRVHRFGAGDRAATLEDLGAFDVVVTSYGLLLSEQERLTAPRWHTAVLDEAQAIKNPSTKRAKAARQIQADARLATTGTPIENHLGELWALFDFLLPGLLGSRKSFERRFAIPIAEGDREARHTLRELVRPFLLRRTKTAVAQDLPARTEVIIRVEPDAEERAHYEAVRRRAVEVIDQTGEQNDARFQVLAQLTRLRQACCDPELVTEGCGIPSAKAEAFLERVEALRAGGHKALVFSQFVRHLTHIRARLDALGVPYQYLDGSTPAREREARVAAFQAGEGDLFLISLRAGGTGLNLTAADYVIHLDPWWNPAVEDQASDRAHRIGQTRPVTVYRLVVADTVEERIVKLHHDKRALADAVLAGTDSATRLDLDALVRLLREG